jgi:hypothetical protein
VFSIATPQHNTRPQRNTQLLQHHAAHHSGDALLLHHLGKLVAVYVHKGGAQALQFK